MHHPRARALLAAPLAALVFLATACGAGDDDEAATNDSATGGDPQSIVSLTPTTTEILSAVGAGAPAAAPHARSPFPDAR